MKKLVSWLIMLGMLCCGEHALCQITNEPIYSELIPTSSGLPFDPATDIQESFKAPNGRLIEVLVKGPQGSGTYTRAIKPGETPDEYFPAVVAEAVQAKAHHLVIPKSVYVFQGPALCTDLTSASCNSPSSCNVNQYYNCQPHWQIGTYPQEAVTVPNSVSDLDIDLSGSELDFSAPVIGIWILEAQRLRLRNFTIDWPSLSIASLGTIVADPDNPGHNALVLDSQYPVTDKYQGGAVQIQAVDPWDDSKTDPPGTFDPKSNNNFETYFIFGDAPQPTYVGKTSAGAHTFSCKSCRFQPKDPPPGTPPCGFFQGCANFDGFAPGARVIVRHYTYNGFAIFVNWANDIDFENVKLRTGPGMGVALSNNGGYRGFRLANAEIARGPGRLISTASDAINLGTQADVILENNEVGYQGDDSINIHSVTASITGVDGATVSLTGPCDPDPMDAPLKGDALAFFDQNFVYKATAHVVAVSGTNCGTIAATLDHAIAGLDTTDSLLDLTQQPSARYIVHNNILRDCRCHGVLVNAPYGLIDHNTMLGNSAGALALAGGYMQGPGATNLSFTGNVVSKPGESAQDYGAISLIATAADGSVISSPIFEKIKIQNNTIESTPGPAFIVTSSRDFSLGTNSIFNTNLVQATPIDWGALSTLDSVIVDRSSNGTVCSLYSVGRTNGPIGTDTTDHGVSVMPRCAWGSGR